MPTKDGGQGVPPVHEIDSDRKHLILKLPTAEPLDPVLPLIIGDCIHNLRSALDHLVFQLALLNKAGTESASKTAFPICLSSSSFNDTVKKKVKPFIASYVAADRGFVHTVIPSSDEFDRWGRAPASSRAVQDKVSASSR